MAAAESERPRGQSRGQSLALRRERKRRGWSQAKLVSELRTAASREGLELSSNSALASMVSRWENGHCEPDSLHRHLLRQVYGKSDVELGFSDALIEAGADARTWLTLDDFCRELEVPYSTACKWSSLGSASGRFPRCRRLPNGKIRIRRDWLEEWLDGLPAS
jgi:transcriptional regulator with XRE-family HTH domain